MKGKQIIKARRVEGKGDISMAITQTEADSHTPFPLFFSSLGDTIVDDDDGKDNVDYNNYRNNNTNTLVTLKSLLRQKKGEKEKIKQSIGDEGVHGQGSRKTSTLASLPTNPPTHPSLLSPRLSNRPTTMPFLLATP